MKITITLLFVLIFASSIFAQTSGVDLSFNAVPDKNVTTTTNFILQPDGKFVAYGAGSEQGGDVFIVSTEVGTPRRLTDAAARDTLPSWSANGTWIYFASNRTGDYEIWKIPVAGGDAVQITWRGAYFSFPAPDGKWIYYSKLNAAGIWRVPVDGGNESQIEGLSEAGLDGTWTATNAGIYFVVRADQPPYKTGFYDFSNGQIKEIGSIGKLPALSLPGFGASSEGKTILYAQQDQNASSIMLAELGN